MLLKPTINADSYFMNQWCIFFEDCLLPIGSRRLDGIMYEYLQMNENYFVHVVLCNRG